MKINNFRGELTDISGEKITTAPPYVLQLLAKMLGNFNMYSGARDVLVLPF